MNNILLIEDEDPFGQNLLISLAELGLSPERVYDGDKALSLLNNKDYDGIILDLKLKSPPLPQGMQVLEWVSSNKKETAIVVVTGQTHLAFRALELGVDALLYKPVDAAHVLQYMQRAIELRKLRVENSKLKKTLKIALSEYVPGILITTLLIPTILYWRLKIPSDWLGIFVVFVYGLILLIGGSRISKIALKLFGQQFEIKADSQGEGKRRKK